MNIRIATRWPLITSMLIYWAALAILVLLSVRMNRGHFVYPLDDTYIHMSIARSVANAGVWGVTPHGFTSSTSSPFWTLLLAVTYCLFGAKESAPLILAVICGSLLIVAAYVCLAKYIKSPGRIFLTLVILIFATPLPSLTFSGMEHVLHMLLVTAFLFLAVPLLSAKSRPTFRETGPLLAVAPFLVVTRYESLFLAFVVCAIFLLQRKIYLALVLGAMSLLPMIVYGIWSMVHGWYFLPNSVILKGHKPHLNPSFGAILTQLGFGTLDVLQANPFLWVLVIFSLLFLFRHYVRGKDGLSDIRWAHIVFLGFLVFHLQFAGTGWFFRYEAYLVFTGLTIAAIAVDELMPQSLISMWKEKGPFAVGILTLLALVMGTPFYNRALRAIQITPSASNNIYEQQYQMAAFLQRYYPDRTVAANDIGAITYFTDIRLVDVMGLGSLETASWRLHRSLTSQRVEALTRSRGVSLALVYDNWLQDNSGASFRPSTWVKVGEWKIMHNVVCGDDTVSIYSASTQGVEQLKENLRKFAPELPQDVEQAGTYENATKP